MQQSREPPVTELPEQLPLLEENGAMLIRRGQHDDAERIFRQIISVAPRHVPALRYLASRALTRGELEEAQRLLERAIRLAPQAAMLHQNLGVILRARGYLEGAMLAFDAALRINPDLTMAWVQRGDILQGLGRPEEATASYKRAEDLGGDLRGLARASREAPRNRRVLRRAAIQLARARETMVAAALAPLRRRHGDGELERVMHAVHTMTRSARPVYADPLQQPAFAYVPELVARPFFDRRELPFLAAFEAQSEAISEEFHAVQTEAAGLTPYVEVPEGHEGMWKELNNSRKWSAYHLYRNGERIEKHCTRCPRTLEAVESLPLVRMQGQAPEIFFSVLEPRTHIPPHHGIANYKLAVHLPIVIPSGCAIRVGDQTRTWTKGECLIFDDSFEHEAWNRSDAVRAVLILEIWNPGLTLVEREALQGALSAIDRFNRKYGRIGKQLLPPGTAQSR